MSSRLPTQRKSNPFLPTMCTDAPESTTNSLSCSERADGASKHQFSESEKEECCFIFLLYFKIFLANFHAASRDTSLLPFRLSLRPILKLWWSGFALMRFTWSSHLERWILVLNVSMTYHGFSESNTSDWLQYVLSSSVKSMKTSAAPYVQIRNPIVG